MSLADSINNFYKKYKKSLTILVLLFFVYKLYNYYDNIYEGLECKTYKSFNACNGKKNDDNKPCLWTREKRPNGSWTQYKCDATISV